MFEHDILAGDGDQMVDGVGDEQHVVGETDDGHELGNEVHG